MCRVQDEKQRVDEERARLAREKLKERRVVDDVSATVVSGPILPEGKTEPYGQWQRIKTV